MLVFGLVYPCLSPFPPFKWTIRVTIYHILRYCKHIFHLCMILTSFQELFESPRRAGLQASGHQTSFMCHVFHDSKEFMWCWNYSTHLVVSFGWWFYPGHVPFWGFMAQLDLGLTPGVWHIRYLGWKCRRGKADKRGDSSMFVGAPKISKHNALFPQDGGAPVMSWFITPSKYNYKYHTLLLS